MAASLLSDLAQAWGAYRASPATAAFQQFEMGKLVNQAIDALWQMEATTASAKEYIEDSLDSAGLQSAVKDLAPLLVVGSNSLAHELRQTWNAHLASDDLGDRLDPLIQRTIKALAHADYFLDEAEGFVASEPNPDAHFEAELRELHDRVFPNPEPLTLV
jgi:hypothetical protein